MGTRREKVPPDTCHGDAGSFSNAPCKKAAPRVGKDLAKRIKAARAALHDAIRRAGDKPLSRSPEVLRLSRELDDLIDEVHSREKNR